MGCGPGCMLVNGRESVPAFNYVGDCRSMDEVFDNLNI